MNKILFGVKSLKVAVVGSRDIELEIQRKYLPENVTAIISGGARGIDKSARRLSQKYGLEYIEFLPDYGKYGARAPLVRNDRIVDTADMVVAFWDGKSRGTGYVIGLCRKTEKPIIVYTVENGHITDVKNENMPLRW